MNTQTMIKLLFGILFFTQHIVAMAENLTPETFLQADVETRQLTLHGMSQQIQLLRMGANDEQVNQLVSDNQANVEASFNSFGTTGPTHSAYGTKNREAIETWMANNPEWQQRYDTLDEEFSTLSQQLSTLREGLEQ